MWLAFCVLSDPYGTRTRVAGVKGRSPRPLDEGAATLLPPIDHLPVRASRRTWVRDVTIMMLRLGLR